MNVAGFTPEFGRRIKSVVEGYSPASSPPGKAFDGRAAHAAFSSPVEIEGEWTQDDTDTAWHCTAKKVVFRDEKYVAADDAVELYDPCSHEKPAYAPGDRVYAVYRGRWELVSGGGQNYFEGKIDSESNGVYKVLLYKDTGTDTLPDPIEAKTRYLQTAEKLEKDTIVGVTWTPMYGYRITHCEK